MCLVVIVSDSMYMNIPIIVLLMTEIDIEVNTPIAQIDLTEIQNQSQ